VTVNKELKQPKWNHKEPVMAKVPVQKYKQVLFYFIWVIVHHFGVSISKLISKSGGSINE